MSENKISPSRSAALTILERVLSGGETLLDTLPLLAEHCPDSRDTALAREIISGTCRWLERLNYIIKQFATQFDQLPLTVQHILQMSVYQMLYLDRVPPYAIISDAVELTRSKRAKGLDKAVNGILRNIQRNQHKLELPNRNTNRIQFLTVEMSHPRWLVEYWLDLWGDRQVGRLCSFNNKTAPLSLRLRGDVEEALTLLSTYSLPFKQDERFGDIVTIEAGTTIPKELFESTRWVVQDGAQSIVSRALAPQEGWRIWDVCAAPGGKTFHLSDLANGNIKIVASDKSQPRMERLVERRKDLGIKGITSWVFDPMKQRRPDNYGLFDAILVDAPCSGWGTFRRHPDLRWHIQKGDSENSGETALSLLHRTCTALKPGGVLVYSTCTLSPFENRSVIRAFLAKQSEFEIESLADFVPEAFRDAVDEEGLLRIFPPDYNLDGMFAARLRRKSEEDVLQGSY